MSGRPVRKAAAAKKEKPSSTAAAASASASSTSSSSSASVIKRSASAAELSSAPTRTPASASAVVCAPAGYACGRTADECITQIICDLDNAVSTWKPVYNHLYQRHDLPPEDSQERRDLDALAAILQHMGNILKLYHDKWEGMPTEVEGEDECGRTGEQAAQEEEEEGEEDE